MPPFSPAAPAATVKPLHHRIFRPVCWAHQDYTLERKDYTAAAGRLACDPAAIEAVALTEVHGQTWDMNSRPLVLFERHHFARLTSGAYNKAHPDISNPHPGGYGPSSHQYDRLRRAAELDETAALKSASWGMFQIMGFNYSHAGFTDVAAMVDAILSRASAHLEAFTSLILHDVHLLAALRGKHWATFARGYNGKNYAQNSYDTKMATHYAALAKSRS